MTLNGYVVAISLVLTVLATVMAAMHARNKNRSMALWAIAGALFGPVALILLARLPAR